MKVLDKVKELKTKYLSDNKKQDNTIYCRICSKRLIDMLHSTLIVVNKLYL